MKNNSREEIKGQYKLTMGHRDKKACTLILVMFCRSKQALCWLSLRVYLSLNLPYPSGHNRSLGHQKLDRPSHRRQNPAFQAVQEYFLVKYCGATNPFQWPLNCLGHCSCQCLTHKLPASVQQQIAQTQLLRAQWCLMHHLEAQAVLQILWKSSEVKGEASWQSWCDSWSLQSALSILASSWAADTAAWEPLARSLTFPDEAVCPCSWIRALEALHHQIQEVFKTLINKHFSLLKAWIRSQDILSFEITTQSLKRSNHSSWNPTGLCRNFSLIKTQ